MEIQSAIYTGNSYAGFPLSSTLFPGPLFVFSFDHKMLMFTPYHQKCKGKNSRVGIVSKVPVARIVKRFDCGDNFERRVALSVSTGMYLLFKILLELNFHDKTKVNLVDVLDETSRTKREEIRHKYCAFEEYTQRRGFMR